MDQEQSDFLNRRLETLVLKQPRLLLLRDTLLAIGGTHLVAPSVPDPDLEGLLSQGSVHTGEVVVMELERNGCHSNVSALWSKKEQGLTAVGTGYALSDDGLWRQHSWGLRPQEIIETTETRTCYFGLRLEAGSADRFAAENID